jgi:hypothetical protein
MVRLAETAIREGGQVQQTTEGRTKQARKGADWLSVTHRDKPELKELRPGEDPNTEYPGDANHWLGVYSELLRLVDEAVFDLRHEHSLSEAELGGYAHLFQRRLTFWQAKVRGHELASLNARQATRAL